MAPIVLFRRSNAKERAEKLVEWIGTRLAYNLRNPGLLTIVGVVMLARFIIFVVCMLRLLGIVPENGTEWEDKRR